MAMRQAESFANGLRFGFLFLRARWFKIPRKIRAAGHDVTLSYPPETGVTNDFFACIIRDEYGLRHGLPEVRTILDIGANIGFFPLRREHTILTRRFMPMSRILELSHIFWQTPRHSGLKSTPKQLV